MFPLIHLSLVPSLWPVGVWSICTMETSHLSAKSWSLFQLVLAWGDCCYSDMYLTVWRSVWSLQLPSVRGASSPSPSRRICRHTGIQPCFPKDVCSDVCSCASGPRWTGLTSLVVTVLLSLMPTRSAFLCVWLSNVTYLCASDRNGSNGRRENILHTFVTSKTGVKRTCYTSKLCKTLPIPFVISPADWVDSVFKFERTWPQCMYIH